MQGRMAETAPFPALAEEVRAKCGRGELRLRRFGSSAEDLDVDFENSYPPQVVTEVLSKCAYELGCGPLTPSFLWSLSVGKRLECLLILMGLGTRGEFNIPLRCPSSSCRKQSEIDFTIAELLEIAARAPLEDRIFVQVNESSIPVRRPTGWDQLAWLEHPPQDENAAVRVMTQRLASDAASDGGERFWGPLSQAVEQTMREHDPLVGLTVSVNCAECGLPADHELDIAGIVLGLLRDRQRQLIRSVHKLARSYHWSEATILSIPPWRRDVYLGLQDEQEA